VNVVAQLIAHHNENRLKVQSIALVLDPIRNEFIQYIQQQLVQFKPRDDYRELLKLSLVFLGADSFQLELILRRGRVSHLDFSSPLLSINNVFFL